MTKKRVRIYDPALAPPAKRERILAPTPAVPVPVPEPSKRWYEDIGPLDQLTYNMCCVAHFALRHHNAEEHIHAYASNVCENGGTGVRGDFLKWLAWLHEVD